jgi:hypothetical protein
MIVRRSKYLGTDLLGHTEILRTFQKIWKSTWSYRNYMFQKFWTIIGA